MVYKSHHLSNCTSNIKTKPKLFFLFYFFIGASALVIPPDAVFPCDMATVDGLHRRDEILDELHQCILRFISSEGWWSFATSYGLLHTVQRRVSHLMLARDCRLRCWVNFLLLPVLFISRHVLKEWLTFSTQMAIAWLLNTLPEWQNTLV